MLIETLIEKNYPTTEPLCGINAIESELMNHRFFVVMEEPGRYMGILTIPDVLARKKKLVADCLTPKPHLTPHSTLEEAMRLMTSSRLPALPIIDEDKKFQGILSQVKLFEVFKNGSVKPKNSLSESIQEEFVKSISHEIRTPLNAIQGLSEVLLYSDVSEEEKEDFASLLHAKTDELITVVDSLLDLSKLNAGDIKYAPVDDIRLGKFCEEIEQKAKQIRSLFKKDHLELICSVTVPEGIQFKSSYTYLQQIMVHLLNNAIKFTNEGKIEFGCSAGEQEQLIFFVKDTGIGIDPERQNIIFNAFEKAWPNDDHIYPGIGIGLTLTTKIIEAAGGHIWFESTPGKGSSFFFRLPVHNNK
ncbi:MAG: ATP-binding protein [Marinilabiliaceae bacterium]